MTGAERGFLLLTGTLGDPDRKPLSTAQMRTLGARVATSSKIFEDRELAIGDLLSLGYAQPMAQRIVDLLNQEDLLKYYLSKGEKLRCIPLSRAGKDYPVMILQKLGLDAPGCLWAKGDLSLLSKPMIALVGSRNIRNQNRGFAAEVGRQAARQGFVLVSGNARGADISAQEACLRAGGQVISVVADELCMHQEKNGVLYLSEDGYDLPFSAQRALSRNRMIHALADKTFVAQCDFCKGGTWSGTVRNLQNNWSPVFCYADGSNAVLELEQMGAQLISVEQLADFGALMPEIISFL